MNLGGKFMLILVITTKLVLFFKQKSLLMEKLLGFSPPFSSLKILDASMSGRSWRISEFLENFLSFSENLLEFFPLSFFSDVQKKPDVLTSSTSSVQRSHKERINVCQALTWKWVKISQM